MDVFVSFVVATFNCGSRIDVLAKTISSFADFPCEFLVADGGSHDGTAVAAAAAGARVICSRPDQGIYDAWNRALPFCSGLYISFIGVDDVPLRSFYEAARSYVSSHQDPAMLIYGDSLLQLGTRRRLVAGPKKPRLADDRSVIFDIPHPGALNYKAMFAGRTFDPSFKLAGDLAFYMSARALFKTSVHKIDQVQAIIDAEGLSRQPAAAVIYEREYKRIEANYDVELGYKRSSRLKVMLAKYPRAFQLMRSLRWRLRAAEFK